ncbi:MAG: sensor histidine kinase KdpD, partial [Rhizobiales bacterium]|nr:sensor histidine kinase KdpD [Hyphomicrobiales bacterium]
ALLAVANRETRGRLKIFLGAAPGVGKTYAMLTAARAFREDGGDVVAGLVETHGRRETEALIAGFEILPRHSIVYRNQVMKEFDLDAALARRPGLLLVDEYAHTNVPGSRHPKRWQDIEELLDNGVDVWTTLNIQHLEGLNDVIQKITKVRVRETVPDTVFEKADELVLVDFPPDELLKRLAEGKVYVQETAARAVESFFKPQNLAALRELALRRAAERIDAALVSRMQAQAIEGPWAAGERIVACVGIERDSETIVRTAKRLADLMDAPWIAITVERPSVELSEEARRSRDDAMRLAETLGGDTKTLVGSDIPDEILRFCKFENVTQIVIGRTQSRSPFRRSLQDEIIRRAEDISVHVVTGRAGPRRTRPKATRFQFALIPYIWSALAVATAVVIGRALSTITPLPNLSMIFLVAVLIPAVTFGIWPAIVASILSFLAYNFFFIEPLYQFTIAEPYELLALVIFLFVAITTSALAGRVKAQARYAADRVRATRRLYEFTKRLSGLATVGDIAEGAASEIHASLGYPAIILLGADELHVEAAWPPEDALDTASWSAARWAFEHREPAGRNTSTLPLVPWFFVPLQISGRALGVVGVALKGERPMDSEMQALFDTLAEQTAAAFERAMLSKEMVSANSAIEAEQIRNTVLASISHDFRTPLASILGSSTSLIEFGEKMDAAGRNELLGHIKDEVLHLDNMVRNLLSMTRIDAGALELRKDWIDLREIAHRVVHAAQRRGAVQKIDIRFPPDLPLVKADALLAEQAIGNIVGNAVKHTTDGSTIVVSAAPRDSEIALTVEDNGPGIGRDILPRVFEKFVTARSDSNTSANKGEGTGLGLAIAKGIMKAHGGEAIAESPVSDGNGTRITLTFPREGA